jgi:hypothetical protein
MVRGEFVGQENAYVSAGESVMALTFDARAGCYRACEPSNPRTVGLAEAADPRPATDRGVF